MMNDETEQFEQRLRRQPVKQIPAEWRAEILAACRASKVESREPETLWPSTLVTRLSTLFWPHPTAWAGLAAVWFFIFVLNLSIRETKPLVAEKSAPPSPEAMVQLKQQQRMFAELVGSREAPEADRPKIFLSKPHSGRAKNLMT